MTSLGHNVTVKSISIQTHQEFSSSSGILLTCYNAAQVTAC